MDRVGRHTAITRSLLLAMPLTIGGVLLPGATADAQQFTFTLPNISATAGDPASGSIVLDSTAAVQGFSLAFCYDPLILSVSATSQGADVAATNGGGGAGFFTIDMAPGAILCGCVINLIATTTLPPAPNLEIVDFTFQTDGSATGMTPLEFCLAGSPPVSTVVVVNGNQSIATQIDGSVDFSPPPPLGDEFERGDCNSDGTQNIADAITLLGNLFPNGTPTPLPCLDACDTNDDGTHNIADAVALLAVLFQGQPAFEPAACGLDPTDTDPFDCVDSGSCP